MKIDRVLEVLNEALSSKDFTIRCNETTIETLKENNALLQERITQLETEIANLVKKYETHCK